MAACPYRIQHQDAILAELRGPDIADAMVWRNDGKPIVIPFEDDGDGAYYLGCSFDRVD